MYKYVRKCYFILLFNISLFILIVEFFIFFIDCLSLSLVILFFDYYSVLRFKRKDNGFYCCMICKKFFCLEFFFLKYIKMYSSYDFCYCRDCG